MAKKICKNPVMTATKAPGGGVNVTVRVKTLAAAKKLAGKLGIRTANGKAKSQHEGAPAVCYDGPWKRYVAMGRQLEKIDKAMSKELLAANGHYTPKYEKMNKTFIALRLKQQAFIEKMKNKSE